MNKILATAAAAVITLMASPAMANCTFVAGGSVSPQNAERLVADAQSQNVELAGTMVPGLMQIHVERAAARSPLPEGCNTVPSFVEAFYRLNPGITPETPIFNMSAGFILPAIRVATPAPPPPAAPAVETVAVEPSTAAEEAEMAELEEQQAEVQAALQPRLAEVSRELSAGRQPSAKLMREIRELRQQSNGYAEQIATLRSRMTAVEGRVTANETNIAANTAAIAANGERFSNYYTKEEIDSLLSGYQPPATAELGDVSAAEGEGESDGSLVEYGLYAFGAVLLAILLIFGGGRFKTWRAKRAAKREEMDEDSDDYEQDEDENQRPEVLRAA